MAEELPVPPTAGYKGTVVTGYQLRVPLDSEVAEVPQDVENLAYSIGRALDGKLSTTAAGATYQPKILVTATLPATAAEGTIVFLVVP
jgi:hypothetical protein